MVASALLGMLVTILAMIFNQSSIAWRTGSSGVANLAKSRRIVSTFQDYRDEALPGLGDQNVSGSRSVQYRTVSLWNGDRLRTDRAFAAVSLSGGTPTVGNVPDSYASPEINVNGGSQNRSKDGYSVGVRSLGPDGRPDTEDDINTWPEEID